MSEQGPDRRQLIRGGAAVAALLGLLGHAFGYARSLVPNILYERPSRRRLGKPDHFPKGTTYIADLALFVLHDDQGFRALSAVCPHLGCTVGEQGAGYHCPCHGSRFAADGGNLSGPAPRPLSWRPLMWSGDKALIVDLKGSAEPDTYLGVSSS